jgi:uncharacterized RDD family membrane protein YckC
MEYTMSPVTMTPHNESSIVGYASFWQRLLAALIDGLLLLSCFTVLGGVLSVIFDPKSGRVSPGWPYALLAYSLVFIALAGPWLYFALMESSKTQGTIGKMAIGIRVTDLNGNRLTFGRATGRCFAKILSTMILLIGFIMAAFTPMKQALHDAISGTLVLSKQSNLQAQMADDAINS